MSAVRQLTTKLVASIAMSYGQTHRKSTASAPPPHHPTPIPPHPLLSSPSLPHPASPPPPPPPPPGSDSLTLLFYECCSFSPLSLSWQPLSGAAQRRRQRRLSSWWRHERQSIASVLATFQHHSPLGDRRWPGPGGGGASLAPSCARTGDAVSLSPGRKGATAPSLAAAKVIDSSALSFLTALALEGGAVRQAP